MEKKEANIKNIIELIKNKFKLIAAIVFIACALVIGYSFIMPYSYLSEASILPPENESGMSLPGFLSDMAGSFPSIGGIGGGGKADVYANILKSRSVAEYIVEDLDLKENDLFEFEEEFYLYDGIRSLVDVYVDKGDIILLNCNFSTGYFPSKSEKDTIAKMSANILNSAIDGLNHVLINRSFSKAKASKEYIQNEILNYRYELDSISKRLVQFQKKHNILEIEEQVQAIVQQAIDVGSQMAEAEVQMNLASIEYEKASPTYKMYSEKFQLLQDQYKQIQKGGLMSEDAFSIPLDEVPQLVKEYTDLYRDKEILERVIIFLETQKHQEAIQEKRDVPIVQVLDRAVTPVEKHSPKRKIMLIATFFVSTVLSILYVILLALYKGKLYLDTV